MYMLLVCAGVRVDDRACDHVWSPLFVIVCMSVCVCVYVCVLGVRNLLFALVRVSVLVCLCVCVCVCVWNLCRYTWESGHFNA
jgi:hypothetical protein